MDTARHYDNPFEDYPNATVNFVVNTATNEVSILFINSSIIRL